MDQMRALIESCVAKESATDEDVLVIMTMGVPTTTTGNCLSACMMESTGVIVDGKFDSEKSMQAAKMLTDNNAEKMAVIASINAECDAKMAAIATSDR